MTEEGENKCARTLGLVDMLTRPFVCPQGHFWSDKASQDEHGEEDHGAAEAGGVQPAGQRPGPDAPAPPVLRAVPPASPHDPEGAGGEALHDAARI